MFFQPIENLCIELSRDHTKVAEYTHILLSLANLIDSITPDAKEKSLKEFGEKEDPFKRKPDRSINLSISVSYKEIIWDKPFKPL